RVRVRGTVGYQQPGKALFLQNQGKGLRVLTEQDTALSVGDVVDVLGFPAMGESAPVLEDAVFYRLRREAVPQPVPLDLTATWETFDGALITTDARLLQREMQSDGLRLLLQHGETLFDATLPPGNSAGSLQAIPLNSQLRITGICLVRSGGLWSIPQSFRVLLRTPQDVTVLRTPS